MGSDVARAELRADIEKCLAAVRREAGVGWLYDCLLLPLANRPGVTALPDEDASNVMRTGAIGTGGEAELRGAASGMLADMLRRTRTGVSAGTALREAVDAWLGDDPCPEDWAKRRLDDLAMRRLAFSLIADFDLDREAA